LIVLAEHGPWENADLRVTSNDGTQDLCFGHLDPGTGRPLRLISGSPPDDGEELRLVELGGWTDQAAPPGTAA
jgi:hypothetical protein